MRGKRKWIVTALTLVLFALGCCPVFAASKYDAEVAQAAVNRRIVKITIPAIEEIVSSKEADTVKATAVMKYDGKTVRSATKSVKVSSIDSSEKSFDMEVSHFGQWTVTVDYQKSGKSVDKTSKTIGVVADTYNVVTAHATTPSLIYTLKMVGGTVEKDSEGNPAPTILMVTRSASFDWDKLPDNLYACPFMDDATNRTVGIWSTKQPPMKAYIESLYALDPGARFVFHVTDYNLETELPPLLWENCSIPETNYKVRIITDGAASYTQFRVAYDKTTQAQKKHDLMVEEMKDVKERAQAGESIDYKNLMFGNIRVYAYALLDVLPDAEWWIIRKSTGDTLAIRDAEFAQKVVADTRVTNNYINNLLATVQSAGKAEEFKALYKFDDSAFEATRNKGKKIMMLLGTSKGGERSAPIEDYVYLTKAFYGSDYEYYYKGHPGYLPELNEGRMAQLQAMNLQVLDSSIAAELFIFFDPDVVMSGYQSTTFQSADSADTCGGLYNISKASAESSLEYASKMDFFSTDLDKNPSTSEPVNKAAAALGGHNFLVELNDTEKADFAIYNADSRKLYFYKTDEAGEPQLVETKGQPKEDPVPARVPLSIAKAKVSGIKAKTFTGRAVKQNLTVKLSGVTLTPGTDYTVKYAGNVNVGKAKLTITGKGSYTGSLKKAFRINPKKALIGKVTGRTRGLRVRWKKQTAKMAKSRITGYQIQLARDKKFTKGKKSIAVKGYKKSYKIIRKLKKRKVYYVRLRTYKTVGGARYFSKWSKVRKAKTR